ncbi:MAG: hypothetical protein K0R78_1761 [Pelosinus sp.]|nr:hypothetical protein [Pelosinus sp.]
MLRLDYLYFITFVDLCDYSFYFLHSLTILDLNYLNGRMDILLAYIYITKYRFHLSSQLQCYYNITL